MLPDYETCLKNIRAYQKWAKPVKPGAVNFPKFWDYKTGLEKAGQDILDEQNLETTAGMLHKLLDYLDMQDTKVADLFPLGPVLRNIRSSYSQIKPVFLGSGKIRECRSTLESIYQRLGGTTREGEAGYKFSIVGKSVILMAIWGQVPRFDSLNRKRFERWTHAPAPEKLPHLKVRGIWYKPAEFCDIVEELDRWVMDWPLKNEGKSFISSFYDLCPGVPPGRQIDIIYHWKMPDPRVDYKLQSQGS